MYAIFYLAEFDDLGCEENKLQLMVHVGKYDNGHMIELLKKANAGVHLRYLRTPILYPAIPFNMDAFTFTHAPTTTTFSGKSATLADVLQRSAVSSMLHRGHAIERTETGGEGKAGIGCKAWARSGGGWRACRVA